MKKILTLLCLVTVTAFTSAQSLKFYTGATDVSSTTLTIPIYVGDSQSDDIDIHNVSSSTVIFKVKRTIMTPPIDSTCSVYFCTGALCYSPSANIYYTGGGSTTLAGMTNLIGANGLLAHFDVLGTSCCDTYIKYQAYVVGAVGDTASVIVHYACLAGAGVQEIEKTGGAISNAYPNPANSIVSIRYNVKEYSTRGKIVIYDMLGKAVKETELNDKEGTARINVSDLNLGIYFYTFFVDDKAIATKKLVISSK